MTEANTQNESSRSPSTPAEDKPVAAQPLPQWPAWWPSGLPQTDGRGTLKQAVEDFLVDELPLAMPCGEGEHVWMWVEKTGANTAFVAAEIARFAGVRDLDVGFAGLKDRHSVSKQWFSVYLPKGETPDFTSIQHDEFKVLSQARHNKKLRRGDLLGNRFVITLRNVTGDREAMEHNLQQVQQGGYPNYFGDQRFGHDGGNIEAGIKMLRREMRVRNANKKSIYLSAVRSYLFNEVLAARVACGHWNRPLAHDAAEQMLDDKGLPTGPMWGRGRSLVSGELGGFEAGVLFRYKDVLDALEHSGLSQERRSLVVMPEAMSWTWLAEADNSLSLKVCFCLGAGYYATSLLKEILVAEEPQRELAPAPTAPE